jgi:UDP-2,4-diacetamido-2,4,6-trideoxy-beta-L-altropyranose hydrolase
MHFVIRADGSREIGYGHLIRSGALAEELLERGHTVTVATTTPDSAQTGFPDTVGIVELSSRGDPTPLVEWLDTTAVDIVFTDAYPVDTTYQRTVRDHVPLAVLQDDNRHAVCAELLVNGNLYAADLDYEYVEPPPETCLGAEYVLFRDEIRARIGGDPPWRDPAERAIITMGGGDATNQTPTVLNAFDGFDISLDVIVGPGFSETQEQTIRATADSVSPDIRIARDPEDLPARMFKADLAVSTASSTTYELLALKTPLITVPVADNQEPIAAALRERDAATVLKRGANTATFRRAVDEYLSDSAFRRSRWERGSELIDGNGTIRVADAVCSCVNSG